MVRASINVRERDMISIKAMVAIRVRIRAVWLDLGYHRV